MDRVNEIQAQWQRERPELDLAPQSIIARLHRLANHLTTELEKVYRQFGLSEGEFDILCAIRREGEPFEVRPAQIAAATMVTTGGTSKRLDRLEKAGFVERSTAQDDGRSRIVRLTPAGLALIDEAFTAHIENEKRLVSTLSVGERAALEPLLRAWLGSFES